MSSAVREHETEGFEREPRMFATGARTLRWLLGPRHIDLPIRVFALISMLGAVFPQAYESNDAGYLALRILGFALIGIAAFKPLFAGIASVCLFLLFMASYPELLNPFQEPLLFSAAVLLTSLRWKTSLALAASAFLLNYLVARYQPMVATPLIILLYSWGVSTLFALSGVLFEWNIHRVNQKRAADAHEHQRELARDRDSFISDTHDTVSHGLATQAAIIRVLVNEKDETESRRLLAELALENGEAQQRLRELLAKLARLDRGEPAVSSSFDASTRQFCERMCASAETGGYRIHARIDRLPESVQVELAADVRSLLRELTTNMLNHSSSSEQCELSVGFDEQRSELMLSSSNPTAEITATAPRTLASRSVERGGRCDARIEQGRFVVQIALPVPE